MEEGGEVGHEALRAAGRCYEATARRFVTTTKTADTRTDTTVSTTRRFVSAGIGIRF